MTQAPPRANLATHEVFNQAPPFVDQNLYTCDAAMVEAVARETGPWLQDRMCDLGAQIGTAEVQDWGHLANRHGPELRQFDRYGHRIDAVEFHPAYHSLMQLACRHNIHDIAHREPGRGAHGGHAALLALFTQVEASVMCPINMTYAAVPALRADMAVGEPWIDRLIGGQYDAPLRPIAQKSGVTLGMAMTEKQGGSDVRANTTRAQQTEDGYRLTGHKWFCSAPMSDGFLTLAYLDDGLTCFLVPRILPDGTRNNIQVMRLKDKLGNKANASSEIEYHGAWAQRLGDPGKGVKTIIEMVHHTRLGTISGAIGLMRMALVQAHHHVSHRSAFQRRLIDQPLMRRVIADLQIEYEAAVALVMHIAGRFDAQTPQGRAYARLSVALAKYLLTKRCPNFVYECMECLGGAGYIEEGPLARIYREAPLNAIWEGSGNVIALDIMRTIAREPEAVAAYFDVLEAAQPGLSAPIKAMLGQGLPPEGSARHLAEQMALSLQQAVLQHSPAAIQDGFAQSRANGTRTYGAAAGNLDDTAILARIMA